MDWKVFDLKLWTKCASGRWRHTVTVPSLFKGALGFHRAYEVTSTVNDGRVMSTKTPMVGSALEKGGELDEDLYVVVVRCGLRIHRWLGKADAKELVERLSKCKEWEKLSGEKPEQVCALLQKDEVLRRKLQDSLWKGLKGLRIKSNGVYHKI